MKILNTPWVQSKTKKITAMPRSLHNDPYFDFMFQYGAFALCDKAPSPYTPRKEQWTGIYGIPVATQAQAWDC